MKFLPESVTSKVAMTVLQARKHSPAITFAIGIAGVVGTAVLASRATLKLDAVLEDANDKLGGINTLEHSAYSEQDRTKDKALVYTQTALKIGKLYLPAIAAGTVTIAALTTSHVTLTRRNVALTAAFVSVEKAFKEYRERVIDDLGADSDNKYRFGLETEKTTVVGEDGKKTKVETKVPTKVTQYGKIFHEGNPNWQRIPEYNIMFLRGVQRMANDRLRAKGHLFLNEVYDDLGVERTPAGQIVGWLYENENGDGYVDFGIFEDADALRMYDYVTGREQEIYLDFNVDGNIYDQI